MRIKITWKKFWRFLYTVIIGALAFSMVLPFIWMLSSSFKVEMDVFNFPVEWIPDPFNPTNFGKVWNSTFSFPRFYLNTIKVTIATTVLQVTISTMAGYAFAKINFAHSKKLFFIYLATLMIPAQVTIIPSFIVMRSVNLINTHMGIILIASFSVYGMFLLRQFISSVPNELSEAAFIDGAGHIQIFIRVIVPIVKPAIATLAMLKFIWTWNDYQHPLIFLISERLFTLQLGMRFFTSGEYGNQYALMMAAAVMAIFPLMIVFIILQRYVIEGIALGAVKG
ncbi:ABC transporter permease [Spirochaetia bacterium]|nr:ABC transporter permease [Spirochaetia bacterium]